MKIRQDLKPGNLFPDIELPDQGGQSRALSQLMRRFPTIVTFWRGRY
jgi:peroxiredoxin